MAMAEGKSKSNNEFAGFDPMDMATDASEEGVNDPTAVEEVIDSRVPEKISPQPSPLAPSNMKKQVNHLKEGDVKLIVDQVVSQLAPTIKSLCVTEKMLKIEVRVNLRSILEP